MIYTYFKVRRKKASVRGLSEERVDREYIVVDYKRGLGGVHTCRGVGVVRN
jgi:hypothetical protein